MIQQMPWNGTKRPAPSSSLWHNSVCHGGTLKLWQIHEYDTFSWYYWVNNASPHSVRAAILPVSALGFWRCVPFPHDLAGMSHPVFYTTSGGKEECNRTQFTDVTMVLWIFADSHISLSLGILGKKILQEQWARRTGLFWSMLHGSCHPPWHVTLVVYVTGLVLDLNIFSS